MEDSMWYMLHVYFVKTFKSSSLTFFYVAVWLFPPQLALLLSPSLFRTYSQLLVCCHEEPSKTWGAMFQCK